MNALVVVAWSVFCVVGTRVLMYFIMQSHMELRLAKQREELAGARATLAAKKEALETR